MNLLILILLSLLTPFYQTTTCTCVKPVAGETTYWSNGEITMKDDKTYKILRGVIQYPDGKPMADALIEVFDKPENVLRSWEGLKEKPIRQRRIAACKTGLDGRFCFMSVLPGRYELRVSKAPEKCCAWDPVRAYIILNPGHKKSTGDELEIPLQISH